MIDKETCGILFQKYHSYVYDFCYKCLKDIHAAEDCTQEVFEIMLKKKNKIDLSENLLSWLYGVSKRVCKKYLSKNSIKFNDIDDYAEIIPDVNASAEKPLLDEIYEFLNKEDADLLFNYINADHGGRKELAKSLGTNSANLYERVKRIKKKVMKHLNNE